MSIFYVNAPAFAVEIERLQNPRLRAYPVVIAAQAAPRAPLLSVSAEAYVLGARKGIKLAEARRLDRNLKIIPANHRLYRRAQDQLRRVVQRFTPRYQAERLGTFSLDMNGSELLFGKTLTAAAKIQSEINRVLSLHSTIGTAENRLVSRIAAKVVRPQGICDIFPGNEAAFLSPLELDYLPALREAPHPELFRELAICKVGDLADIPTALLSQIFGKTGELLKQQARGIDAAAVEMPQTEDLLRQEILLSPETNEDPRLLSRLWTAVECLARRLRERSSMAGEIRLHAVYADQQRISEKWPVSPPSQLDLSLFAVLERHWQKFLKRRIALKWLELGFSKLCPAFNQLSFQADQREAKLLAALDALRRRYGSQVVRILKG